MTILSSVPDIHCRPASNTEQKSPGSDSGASSFCIGQKELSEQIHQAIQRILASFLRLFRGRF